MKDFVKRNSRNPVLLFAFFAVLFFSVSCKSKDLVRKNWESEMLIDGEKVLVNLKFQKKSFKTYAKGSNWRQQVAQGNYALSKNLIVFTVTHEFNPNKKRMEKLKSVKVYKNSYTSKDGKLILE